VQTAEGGPSAAGFACLGCQPPSAAQWRERVSAALSSSGSQLAQPANILLPAHIGREGEHPSVYVDTGVDIDSVIGSLVITLQKAHAASDELYRQADDAEAKRVEAESWLQEAKMTEKVSREAATQARCVVTRLSQQINSLRRIRDDALETRHRVFAPVSVGRTLRDSAMPSMKRLRDPPK